MPPLQFIAMFLGFACFGETGAQSASTTVTPTSTISLTLPETTPIMSWHLPLNNVTTADTQQITCTVTGDTKAQEYFSIFPRTCLLTVAKPLNTDPDNTLSYNVYVQYNITSDPGDVSYILITVLVTRNQYGPVFSPVMYTGSINDYDPIGTSVITVSASDNDVLAPSNMIFYTLSTRDSAVNEYFTIHPYTGLVTVSKRLSEDAARPSSYTLHPVASDMGCEAKSSTGTVVITVSRNTAPMFLNPSNYVRYVSESAPVLEETLLTVSARDADSPTTLNGELSYSIVTEEANKVFHMNSSTGVITPRVDLSRVTTRNWGFEVEVTDAGVPPLTDVAVANILITMEPFPTFTPSEYEITISVNRPVNGSIFTTQATDPMPGSVLVYKLQDGCASPGFFSINNKTGEIYLTKSLQEDSLRATMYQLRVVAFRESNPFSTGEAIVRIRVIRNPNTPDFSSQNTVINLSESQPVGSQFASVSARDADSGENGVVEYSISPSGVIPSYSYGYFFVNPQTGALILTSSLYVDPNTMQYQFTVVASDHGAPSRSTSVLMTIRVSRNPSAPVFQLDMYTVTIPATAPPGENITTVQASDSDGDPVSYSILQEPPDSFYFNINTRTGLITLSRSLSQDIQDRYMIRVVATDNRASPRYATGTVVVTVIRNPNPPIFNSHPPSVNVSEYASLMTRVTRVTATDADSPISLDGQIRYSIRSYTPPSASDYFILSPTTGDIILARPLANSESPDNTQLSIAATDRSTNPKTASTQITLNVVRNLHAPVFDITGGTVAIDEYEPFGKIITRITATDADSLEPLNRNTPNAEIEYMVIPQIDHSDRYFGVDNSGAVYLKTPLNSNQAGNYTIQVTIRAQDKSWNPKHADFTLYINVTKRTQAQGNLGFIQPVYVISVRENTPNRTLLFLDVVNQQDNLVTCSFVGGNEDSSGMFNLQPDADMKNCVLVLGRRRSLDRERKDSFRFIVRVDSSRRGKRAVGDCFVYNAWREAEINLFVTDVNDNAPVFTYPQYPTTGYAQDKYYTAISADAKPLTEVTRVTATDRDEGPYGMVVYDINLTQPFSISPTDGVISSTIEFDSSWPRQYRLPVHARDSPVDNTQRWEATTEMIVNLIEEDNRFVLVFNNKSSDEIIPHSEDLRMRMQLEFGYLTIIEQFEAKRTLSDQNSIDTDIESTDVIFVLVGNEAYYDYQLLSSNDLNIRDRILSDATMSRLMKRLQDDLSLDLDNMRLPYPEDIEITTASLPTGGPTAPSAGFAERHDLDCSAGVMHIHLPLSLFPTHSVTLRDPTCKVTSNGTHLVTDIGLNQCGTTVTFTNDSVIFNNDLLATASNNPGATVATIIDFGLNSADQRVPVSCIFPRESRLDFGYIPLQRTAHFYEKQYGHLDFEVRHYQTEQYRTLVPNTGLPVGVPLNTEVFIDLFVDQTNHKGVGIFVDSCIATPTTNPADPLWYPLVKDGCPMQADVRTFTTPDVNEFRFSFLAFKFTRAPLQKPAPSLPPSPMVYLHCQVSACPSGNCSTSCHSPSTRTRRSADQQKSHLISTGPFYLKTDDHDQEGYSTAVVVATMSVAAVATLVAMVAIVAWRRSANKLSKYRASTMDVTS